MKTAAIALFATFVCLTLLISGFPLSGSETSVGPSAYDSVAAAPDNHRVVFENRSLPSADEARAQSIRPK